MLQRNKQSMLTIKCKMIFHGIEKAKNRLAANFKLKEEGVEFISIWN